MRIDELEAESDFAQDKTFESGLATGYRITFYILAIIIGAALVASIFL